MIVWQYIVRFSLSLWRILSEGIRAKLAWFTGSLIAVTILLLSFLTVNQQTAILSDSYEKQASVSRNFIAGLVSEIESISQNLIRIEEFKDRIQTQKEELKKYKTSKLVTEQKTVSLFGIKTNLFGSLGTKRTVRRVDTYFSVYLTKDDVGILEKEIRHQLFQASGKPLLERDWNRLTAFAKNYVDREQLLNELLKREIPNEEKEKNLLEKKIRKARTDLRNDKAKLDQLIAKFYSESKKRKLEELGLDTQLFRIQTFPLASFIPGEHSVASFDTITLDSSSPIAKLANLDFLEESLTTSFQAVNEDVSSFQDKGDAAFASEGREIQALHAPLFRHAHSTKRAFHLLESQSDLKDYREVVQDDFRITKDIQALIPILKQRLDVLKNAKPPIPPRRDKLFVETYKQYNRLVEEREAVFEKVSSEYPIEIGLWEKFEALRSLRDSAIEDWTLLKFNTNQDEYLFYYQDPEYRNQQRKKWKAIRNWVSEAEQETPTKALRKLYPDASFGHSRSETEELLWKLDGTHILDGENVAKFVLKNNASGLIRTLVDRTEGIRAIQENRNQIIFTALTICLFAIIFATFISGIVVQKIRKIIRSAEDVGRGNLNVTFEDGGNDEFGNLTVALNQMVSGLKEREKMRGVLGSMVDPVVVGEALKDLAKLKAGSEKVITAFFSDIAGFSAISEKLNSKDLADLLNEYLSAMTIILKKYDGVLDKYIGDAIVGIFNAPLDVADHCKKAVLASLEMQKQLEVLKADWIEKGKYIPEAHRMSFRIGLNLGYAKVGFMGTDALASYTMMGDTVNLASRLEAAAKDYGVSILVSEYVWEEIQHEFLTRKLDRVRVKGKLMPVTLYEVRAKLDEITPEDKSFVEDYEKGLFLYFNQKFSEAKTLFQSLAKKFHDEAAGLLAERCGYYESENPGADWDGVFTRKSK